MAPFRERRERTVGAGDKFSCGAYLAFLKKQFALRCGDPHRCGGSVEVGSVEVFVGCAELGGSLFQVCEDRCVVILILRDGADWCFSGKSLDFL